MVIFGIIAILKQTPMMQTGHFLLQYTNEVSNYTMYSESKILLIQQKKF